MWPDRVSNLGPLTLGSDVLTTALRALALAYNVKNGGSPGSSVGPGFKPLQRRTCFYRKRGSTADSLCKKLLTKRKLP